MNLRCPLILASSSPRRKFLMEQAGFAFTTVSPDIDESFPATMEPESVPAWLAERKAAVISISNEIVIASDTVVILDNKILNKPAGREEGIRMLTELSGCTHLVVTAVCLRSKEKSVVFSDRTAVTFRSLPQSDIVFYVDHFNPLDKAGSYGAQDCLPPDMNPCSPLELDFLKRIHKPELIRDTIRLREGETRVVIIDHLEGSYFTVMGLPIHIVYDELKKF